MTVYEVLYKQAVGYKEPLVNGFYSREQSWRRAQGRFNAIADSARHLLTAGFISLDEYLKISVICSGRAHNAFLSYMESLND